MVATTMGEGGAFGWLSGGDSTQNPSSIPARAILSIFSPSDLAETKHGVPGTESPQDASGVDVVAEELKTRPDRQSGPAIAYPEALATRSLFWQGLTLSAGGESDLAPTPTEGHDDGLWLGRESLWADFPGLTRNPDDPALGEVLRLRTKLTRASDEVAYQRHLRRNTTEHLLADLRASEARNGALVEAIAGQADRTRNKVELLFPKWAQWAAYGFAGVVSLALVALTGFWWLPGVLWLLVCAGEMSALSGRV